MDPCERFGIFNDTAAAIFAAVSDRSRFTFNTLVALALVRPVSTPIGLDVDVTGVVAISSTVVVGASVEDGVVLATVETTDDDELLGGSVVAIGNALKNGTATATLLLSCELSPNWPNSFKPQHSTSPAGVIAQACDAPAAIATAPASRHAKVSPVLAHAPAFF